MSLDLENQNIKDTFQRLVQVSGSNLVDGTGSVLLALKADNLEGSLSGSFEGTFTQGKIGDGIDITSGSTIFGSFGYNGSISASLGLSPGGFVLYSGSSTTTLGADTLSGTGFQFVSANDNSHIIFTDQNDGDLSIKTDKFVVENNGNLTASNALFDGIAVARNFSLASDVITGPEEVIGIPSNFGSYLELVGPGEQDYRLRLDGTLTGPQGTGKIINEIEFRLSRQINLTDIIVVSESSRENDKTNLVIRNRADSQDLLGFSVKQPNGNSFFQEMLPSNIYTFEVSFDDSGTKTITALTATDFSVPFTASNKGFQLLGDINQTGNINQTGTITTSGNVFTNAKISAGNSRPDSPSKTLHISSSINGDGIRVQGPNNPLIQASNDTGGIYSIGAITSANTQLTGSVAGDTTFRYANDNNPNGRLLFGSGSTTTPILILGGTTARVTDNLVVTGSDEKNVSIETNSITLTSDNTSFHKITNTSTDKGVQTFFNNVTNTASISAIGTTQLNVNGTADTASYVENAQTSSFVETAQTASYVENSQTASYVENAQTASFVTTSQTASYVDATNVDGTVTNAQTASFVTTAQTASYIDATNVDGTVVSASYAATSSLSQNIEVTAVDNNTNYPLLFVANSGSESVLIDTEINKLRYNPFDNELRAANIEVASRLTIPGFTNVSASLAAINTTFDTGSFVTSGSFNSSNSTISLFNPDETFILDLSSLVGGAGGLAITASNEGSVLTQNARSFDFTGNAVTATNVGTAITVDINTGSNDTTLQTVLDNGNSATQNLTLTGLLTINGITVVTGSDNNSTGVGSGTLVSNTGASVSAFGNNSLRNNTANNASGFGNQALQNNEGANSSGLGALALTNNIGSNVSGVGHQALQYNSGSYSSGFGKESLRYNKQSNASGFGSYTLMYNNGFRNTAIGFEAGSGSAGVQELSNNDNTFLGAQTVFENSNIQNSTAVGANVALTDSNTVILGNNANVGIGTSSPSSKLEVNGNITATSFTGSLLGTATTASYVETAQTSSYVENAQTASFVTTAQTASYIDATNVDGTVNTSSVSLTSNINAVSNDANYQLVFTSPSAGDNQLSVDSESAKLRYNPSTNTLTVNNLVATNTIDGTAATASYVTTAQTASFVTTAQTASFVTTAQTASYVAAASIDGTVVSASHAITSSYIDPSSLIGGSNGQVQFNNNGEFGGDSGFTYNSTTDTVTITSVNSSTPSLYVATTETTPAPGDVLAEIEGYSTEYNADLGGVKWVGDDAWSGGDYPTRLEFQTIGNGGTTPTTKLTIKNNGRVGIGTTGPTNGFFEVNGNVSGTSIYASHNIVAYSDARSKTNVETITSALDKVDAIRGVTYNKVEDPDGIRYMGVIAQELQEVLPEVVSEGEDGKLAVAYGNITGVLIEAIKELKAEIAELKANK